MFYSGFEYANYNFYRNKHTKKTKINKELLFINFLFVDL